MLASVLTHDEPKCCCGWTLAAPQRLHRLLLRLALMHVELWDQPLFVSLLEEDFWEQPLSRGRQVRLRTCFGDAPFASPSLARSDGALYLQACGIAGSGCLVLLVCETADPATRLEATRVGQALLSWVVLPLLMKQVEGRFGREKVSWEKALTPHVDEHPSPRQDPHYLLNGDPLHIVLLL